MDPTAQILLGAAALIIAMKVGYGGVIAAVQRQNIQQQGQLNEQGSELTKVKLALKDKDKECDDKIAALVARTIDVEKKQADVEKIVKNGGS